MNGQNEIVLYRPDETLSLEVKLDVDRDTVWLSQQQMGELFGVKENNITYHIKEIYASAELQPVATTQKIRVVRKEGNRMVNRAIDFYNLDMIIAVGYRVNSRNATMFRQWATNVLKQYLLRGYAVNQQMMAMQRQMDARLEEHTERLLKIEDRQSAQQEQIDFFIRTNQPPHEGCVFQGHLLEGRDVAEQIIKSASREIILIDAYVGADTFHILEARRTGVVATIYTERVGDNITTLQRDHETEYGVARHIEVLPYRTDFHDRFLIADDTVYHFGASLKDLGKRLFAFDVINLPKSLIMGQVK